jgi:hypothetical protein
MADLITTALARIEIRQARFVQTGRLNQVIARQRRELAAEAQPKKE